MSDSPDQDVWVTWNAYHRAIEQLVILVHESGWKFDQVLCLARGGLRPGDVFSRVFDVPLAILSTSSYREDAGTSRGELDIGSHIAMAKGPLSGKVLLLDDLVDSGVTLSRVRQQLETHFPAVTEIKSAVIWYKACSSVRPDYFLEYLEGNPWIRQPFEEYDNIRPGQLADLIKAQKNQN